MALVAVRSVLLDKHPQLLDAFRHYFGSVQLFEQVKDEQVNIYLVRSTSYDKYQPVYCTIAEDQLRIVSCHSINHLL